MPNTTLGQVFSLECNVPIQFEYELTIEKHHSDFKVFPMRGVVPANDAVKICIEFTPLSFGERPMTTTMTTATPLPPRTHTRALSNALLPPSALQVPARWNCE